MTTVQQLFHYFDLKKVGLWETWPSFWETKLLNPYEWCDIDSTNQLDPYGSIKFNNSTLRLYYFQKSQGSQLPVLSCLLCSSSVCTGINKDLKKKHASTETSSGTRFFVPLIAKIIYIVPNTIKRQEFMHKPGQELQIHSS